MPNPKPAKQSSKGTKSRRQNAKTPKGTSQGKRKAKRQDFDPVSASLYQDTLMHINPPSASYEGGYSMQERSLRHIPVAGAAASVMANTCSYTVNPWYSAFNFFSYEKMIGSVLSVANIPILFANNGLSNTVVPTPLNQINLNFLQYRDTLAGSGKYSGHVRVIGVEVDIEYTGTLLNSGGMVTIYHGAGKNSGVISNTVTGTGWGPAFTTFSLMAQDTTRTTQVRFDKRCKFVWRPGHHDFMPVKSYRECSLHYAAAAALADDFNQSAVGDILAPDITPHHPVDTPWGLHFNVTLAQAVAAGTDMPLIVRMRAITHESLTYDAAGTVDLGYPLTLPTHHAIANTPKLDAYRTALSNVHNLRSKVKAVDNQRPLSVLGGLKAAAFDGAKSMAEGFLTKAGESLF